MGKTPFFQVTVVHAILLQIRLTKSCLQLNFSSSKSQMSGSRMWPETIKNIFLIVTCNITIIGTKESAVAQYLCCNPNWHSLECFSSKTRHRPKPVLCAWEGELLLLETSSRGNVPWVPLLLHGLGEPSGEVARWVLSLAVECSGGSWPLQVTLWVGLQGQLLC